MRRERPVNMEEYIRAAMDWGGWREDIIGICMEYEVQIVSWEIHFF